MSLVGPRPLTYVEVADLDVDQRRSLGVRPGITGPWQTDPDAAASEADMRAKDAEYFRRWRLCLDLAIMLATPVAVARCGFYLGDSALERQRRHRSSGGLLAAAG